MIVCCGEALIDMLPRESHAGEPCFAPYPGGAVFNTAIALGRLGVPAGFFTGLSRDLFGDMLRETLENSNVATGYTNFSDRPTTLAFVRLAGGQASYLFYDENTAGRMLVEADLPVLDAGVEALHFSCISLISEPCGSTYEALMRREHQNRVMMLDPNIRSSFIQDKPKHLARMRRMIAMADVVKLSDEDLSWFGESGSFDDVAGAWLELGPKLIVVTHGPKGAVGYSRRHKVEVPSQRVTVADTVGAGDTFNAGILASLHQQDALKKATLADLSEAAIRSALSLGAKAAAVTVSRAGANPPWKHELG